FGRDFSDEDGQPQPPPPAPGTQLATPPQRLPIMAIISYEYFQRRFGSNPAVLGQSLNKGKPFSPRIVGVLAPHFQIYFPHSADLEAAPEIWIANRLGYDAAQRTSVSMRASLRQRELAIRSAIGASWWDLASQILSEALLLATIGALGGLGIAWLGIHELLAIAPAHLPRLDTVRIDSTVLIFTVISSLVAAAIFGMAPAWRAARPDVMIVLRGTSRS